MSHFSTRLIRRVAPALVIAGLAVGLTGCGGDDDGTSPDDDETPGAELTVAAAFFPIEEVVRAVVAGTPAGLIDIVTLVPPGEEAHEFEPTAQQLEALERADVVVYLGSGFQPSVEQAISNLPSDVVRVDLLDSLVLLPLDDPLAGTEGDVGGESIDGDLDPHVWLDPANMAAMADRVLEVLTPLVSTADATTLDSAASAYRDELADLDQRFAAGLATCDSRVIVTGHRAFAYLAAAYDLRQIPIAGISPSEEPSAKTLEAVADLARDEGVQVVFFEDDLPDDLARTVADEIGVGTAVLDTAESLSPEQRDAGATYSSLMDTNLATLRTGLGCT